MDDRDAAIERLRPFVDRARKFSGWTFDGIAPTRIGPAMPWDYVDRASALLVAGGAVLDMGTGGGELFERLAARHTGLAVATEEWPVNVPVASRRLTPHGIHVVRSRGTRLPFRDGAFDVVLNRHEELAPEEVARVLAPGGRVLTQQIGAHDWQELRRFFPRMTAEGNLFDAYRRGFQRSGLRITVDQEHDMEVAYAGLGEIVFILCLTPWTINDFDPLGSDLDALLRMERALTSRDGLALTESRFIIEARKGDG